MDIVLSILALAGIAAALWHLIRAGFRFLRYGATGFWADELARTHARRGDVTAMEESRQARASTSRWKARAGIEAVGWLVLLLVPPLTPWARYIYAAYTLLWVVPTVRGGAR